MKRNSLSSIIAAALLPVGSLWAVPNNSATQYVNQINEQAYQIQTDAGRLETLVRSGADEWTVNAGCTAQMEEGTQKLVALLNQIAAQPGASNETRLQVEKMKSMAAELTAFTHNTYGELELRALPLHAKDVLANTASIEDLCAQIHSAAQSILLAR
jgi:hypothetical protein